MRFDLSSPVFEGVKGLAIVDGVSHDDAHSALVVGLSDGLEALLAGGIPNLHSDFFAINIDSFDFKIDT